MRRNASRYGVMPRGEKTPSWEEKKSEVDNTPELCERLLSLLLRLVPVDGEGGVAGLP